MSLPPSRTFFPQKLTVCFISSIQLSAQSLLLRGTVPVHPTEAGCSAPTGSKPIARSYCPHDIIVIWISHMCAIWGGPFTRMESPRGQHAAGPLSLKQPPLGPGPDTQETHRQVFQEGMSVWAAIPTPQPSAASSWAQPGFPCSPFPGAKSDPPESLTIALSPAEAPARAGAADPEHSLWLGLPG